MSYREILKKQIADLEQRIKLETEEKEILQKQLTKLKLAEFEEDINESRNRQLLQE